MNSGVFVTYLPAAYIDRNLIYFIDKMYFKENEDMLKKEEFEIVQHTTMNYLEIFLVEMTARSPHGHGDLEIGILLDGSLTLFTEFKQHELHAGDIYIINRYQIHSFFNHGSQNQILAFQIHPDFYRRIDYQLGFLRFDNNIIRNGELHDALYQTLLSCAASYFSSSAHNAIKCSSLLLEAIYQLLTSTKYTIASEKESATAKNNSKRLNRITDYISEHYMEHIALQDIAGLENITTYHASHFITQMLGISFQEYLNNIRFEHAFQLISKSDLPILDVCLETGFSSSRYLNQMFMRNLGCSVKEYRKKLEKPRPVGAALPTDNIQNRYSFEQAAFVLSRIWNTCKL
ncbi:AraC family transcriptional regulator [Faecalicatena contorta]|nr:AraC family transcriptional regulator [Faecalicatena contorta]